MKKLLPMLLLIALPAVMFVDKEAHAAADMWCVKETTKCAYGTPSTSKLSLVDRGKALYKMTIDKYNEAAGNKTFEAKTSNELIVLAKALIASQVCNSATHNGTWPNCVLKPPPPPPKPTCHAENETYNAATNKCDPIPCGPDFLPGNKPNCTLIPVTPPSDMPLGWAPPLTKGIADCGGKAAQHGTWGGIAVFNKSLSLTSTQKQSCPGVEVLKCPAAKVVDGEEKYYENAIPGNLGEMVCPL
jgi:hypothetical protein